MSYDIGPKIGIDGEAEFRKQIGTVSAQLKTLGTEMGAVTAQFARNASGQDALSAKTAVLNKQIDAQKEKLALQQDMLARATAKYGAADERTQKWQQTVNRSTAELHKMENALQDTGDAMGEAGDSTLKFGDMLKAHVIGEAIVEGIKKVAGVIRDMAGEFIESAASVKAMSAQFEQTFGTLGGEASDAINRVADASGILATRLQGTGTQIYAFARSAGGDTAQSMDIMERALTVAADSAAYYDRSLEDATESLQSFLKGNYANDAALGLSATEVTRNAAAMELFGQKFKDLTEIQKQETLLKMVEDSMKLSGAMGQAQREADGWENVQGNLTEAWKQFQAAVGLPFLSNLVPLIQQGTTALQGLTENTNWDAFTQGVTSAFDAVKQLFAGDTGGITTLVSQMTDALLEGMVNMGTLLAENLPNMSEVALTMIADLAGNLRENAGKLADGAVGLIQGLAQGMADSIPVFIEKVPGIISDLAGIINDNAPKLLGAAANLIGTLANGMIEAIPTLVANIPQILKAIWDVFTAFQWLDLGSKIMQGVGNGIRSMVNFIREQASAIGDDLIGYFMKLPAKLKEIGSHLIDGLLDGLTGKFEAIKGNITGIASKITGLFTSTWDVNSPSRVFMTIGEYLMDGLEIGMENGKGKIMATVEDIAGEVTDRFRTLTSALDTQSDISDLQYQLWEMTAGKNAGELERYDKKLELLTEQEATQAGVLEATQAVYQSMADQYGANSAEALSYMKTLLQEQIQYQKLADSIQEVIDKQRELSGSINISGSYADLAGTMQSGYGLDSSLDRATANMVNGMSTVMSGTTEYIGTTVLAIDGREFARVTQPYYRSEDKSNPEVVSDV